MPPLTGPGGHCPCCPPPFSRPCVSGRFSIAMPFGTRGKGNFDGCRVVCTVRSFFVKDLVEAPFLGCLIFLIEKQNKTRKWCALPPFELFFDFSQNFTSGKF